MANPYRELLAVPGAKGFVVAGAIGRAPMAMAGIAIVLLVSDVTGSYGTAGAVAATAATCFAIAAPFISRLADRHGQHRVLLPAAAGHAISTTALVTCAVLEAPVWTLFAAAAADGLTSPSLGSMIRTRWKHVLTDRASPSLNTAYSFESVADELIFITGPIIVTLLATGIHPAAGSAAAGLLVVTGCLMLAPQRRTQPPSGGRSDGGGSAIAIPGLRMLAVVFLLLGSAFGSIEVTVIAFADDLGHRGSAGIVLASFALGSLVAGLWYGTRRWKTPLDRRFIVGLLLLAIGVLPTALIPGIALMTVVIFFSGLAISPTIIPGFGLAERLVPGRLLTEGLSWLSTSVGLGIAIGAPVAGRLADAYGPSAAFLYPAGAAWLALLVALAGSARLRPSSG